MRTTIALLLVLALTACGGATSTRDVTSPAREPSDTPSPDDTEDPVAGSWALEAADPAVPIQTGLPFTLDLERRQDGALRLSGRAPCNIFGATVFAGDGGWEVEGGDYTVDGAGCEPAVMAAEQAYLDALRAVTQWSLPTTDLLELTGPATRLQFRPAPAVAQVPLVSTTWVVVSTVDGTGPDATTSALPAGAPQPMLRFVADGLLQLDTGCQGYEGRWSFADDGSIALESLERGVEDREPCTPNGAALAEEVAVSLFAVIDEGGFTASVQDNRLRLERGDVGLEAIPLVED